MIGWIIGIGIIVVLVFFIIFLYNSVIRLRNQVKNAWAQIDVQLKRRNDLIPNLVETVKGYMKHEKETLENITKARSAVMSAEGVEDTAQASNMLSSTLKSLFAVSENYPDLKANQNFIQLQTSLNEIEEQISAARRAYNASVTDYNNAIEMFPTNIAASIMGYERKDYFEIGEGERHNVDVNINPQMGTEGKRN